MGEPLEKARRQEVLLEVLRGETIGTQEELRRALRRRSFSVTQATLSRDLKELRVPCVPTAEGGYRYAPPEAPGGEGAAAAPAPAPARMRSVAAFEVTGIDANETAVVVRTLTGHAQGVAVYLDGLRLPEVLATVAGDDTIVVLPRSVKRTAKVRDTLAEVLGLG